MKLGNGVGDVRLDITALTQYSGQGKCEEVSLMLMESEHGEEVRR